MTDVSRFASAAKQLLRQHPNIIILLGLSWEELHLKSSIYGFLSEFASLSIAPILILEEASSTLEVLYEIIAQGYHPELSMDKLSLGYDIAFALRAVQFA